MAVAARHLLPDDDLRASGRSLREVGRTTRPLDRVVVGDGEHVEAAAAGGGEQLRR